MARLVLEAKTPAQGLILQYLEANASDSLVDRINTGKKTLNDCFSWIKDQARKRAVNGVAAIEDRQVYGWAIHYFEENGNPGDAPADDAPPVITEKPVRIVREAKKEEPRNPYPEPPKKEPKPKKADAEQINGQTSIFDFL